MQSKLTVNAESGPSITFKDGAVEIPKNNSMVLFVIKGAISIQVGAFRRKDSDMDDKPVINNVWAFDRPQFGFPVPVSPISNVYWSYASLDKV